MISGATEHTSHLFESAWDGASSSHRPSTVSARNGHFRTFLAFLTFLQLPIVINVHNILIFLEYLHNNTISPKVIRNYLSSISALALHFNLDPRPTKYEMVLRFLRSISINSIFSPTPRGIFSIEMLYHISLACDILPDPILYRSIFLLAYFGFLRMSNIAPHSLAAFDSSKHFLQQDLRFFPPGTHLIIKWTKTLQDNKSHHVIQIPSIQNIFLCPVRALQALLKSRPLLPSFPLFAHFSYPHHRVIDTHIRNALKKVLAFKNFPLKGFGFNTFRRSGATFAFDYNVALQNIMAHGLWRSLAVWTYLQNASQAPSIIPTTFAF